MHNPFTEVAGDDHEDVELVRRAKNGDRDALERLILAAPGMDLQHRRPHGLSAAGCRRSDAGSAHQGRHSAQHISGRKQIPHLALPNYGQSRPQHETSRRRNTAANFFHLRCRDQQHSRSGLARPEERAGGRAAAWSKRPRSPARPECCSVWIANSD